MENIYKLITGFLNSVASSIDFFIVFVAVAALAVVVGIFSIVLVRRRCWSVTATALKKLKKLAPQHYEHTAETDAVLKQTKLYPLWQECKMHRGSPIMFINSAKYDIKSRKVGGHGLFAVLVILAAMLSSLYYTTITEILILPLVVAIIWAVCAFVAKRVAISGEKNSAKVIDEIGVTLSKLYANSRVFPQTQHTQPQPQQDSEPIIIAPTETDKSDYSSYNNYSDEQQDECGDDYTDEEYTDEEYTEDEYTDEEYTDQADDGQDYQVQEEQETEQDDEQLSNQNEFGFSDSQPEQVWTAPQPEQNNEPLQFKDVEEEQPVQAESQPEYDFSDNVQPEPTQQPEPEPTQQPEQIIAQPTETVVAEQPVEQTQSQAAKSTTQEEIAKRVQEARLNDQRLTRYKPYASKQTPDSTEDIISRINYIKTHGASKETMKQIAVLLHNEREKKENRTPEQQRRMNEALADLLKAMNKLSRS